MAKLELPTDLLQRSAAEGTRWAALAVLAEGRRASRRLAKRADDEALHDLRVSVRRLRSLGRLHARHLGWPKPWLQALRDIQRQTGGARDAEVQAAWIERWSFAPDEEAGVAAFLAWNAERADAGASDTKNDKKKKKRKTKRKTKRKKDKKRKASAPPPHRLFDDLAEELESALSFVRVALAPAAPPESYGTVLAGVVRGQLAELLALLEAGDDPYAEELHDARIEGKKLRYVLEPARAALPGTASVLGRLKELQETLGDLHDMQLLGETVARARVELEDGAAGLDAIAAHAQAEAARKHGEFVERFGAPLGRNALADQVEALARRLDASAQIEVERKYLLSGLPEEARRHPSKELLQGYLPGAEIRERLRRITKGADVTYRRTLKAGRGVQRIEVEEETDAALFTQMWPLTEGARVHKRRYVVKEGDLVWEIDAFLDRELFLAEVELPSADMQPTLPAWLAPFVVRDVTEESTYVNQNLAR